MRHYRLGAHTKSDLKVHLVWVPKYRKAILVGDVAIRVRDLLRQIAAEHELEIVSGKVARDHVHVFVSYRPNQDVSQIVQWLKQLPCVVAGISQPAEEVLGAASVGTRLSSRQLWHHHRRHDSPIH